MSIATRIQSIETHLGNAYTSIANKGIDLTRINKNIENLSSTIDQIPNDEWQPQPDWWDIKNILDNDTENYSCKFILLLQDVDSTSVLNRLGASKIKTSDGVEYDTTSTSYNHTWDTTKDKPCSLGYKTRYVIYYFSSQNINAYNTRVNDKALYIYAKNINNTVNFNSFSQLYLCECIELNNCYFSSSYLFFNNNYNLVKLVGVNSTANNLSGSGAGFIQNDYKLRELGLNCDKTIEYTLRGTFINCYSLKINEYIDLESMGIIPSKVKSYWGTFTTNVKTIKELNFDNVDASNDNNYKGVVNGDISLVSIETIGTIKLSGFTFANCILLDKPTLLRILNALYDYSGSGNTYTLTLGNTNLAKLTAEEIAIGTNKGWTIN